MILFKIIKNSYTDTWADYQKTKSFTEGARWNEKGTPAMYLSSNIQNAMLEAANYSPSPKIVNKLFSVCVFEFPELRLKAVEPDELPSSWNATSHTLKTKEFGSNYLLGATYQGIILPSVTMNSDVALHPINAVRQSVYANVVINPESVELERVRMLSKHAPVYSERMFL